MISVAIIS